WKPPAFPWERLTTPHPAAGSRRLSNGSGSPRPTRRLEAAGFAMGAAHHAPPGGWKPPASPWERLTTPHPAAGSRRPPHDVGRRNLLSRSFQPRADAIGHLAAGADVPGGGRQDLQEGLAVVAAENPVVEDGDRAAVGRAPDQAAESLLQAQRRLRKRELGEGIPDLLRASGEDR